MFDLLYENGYTINKNCVYKSIDENILQHILNLYSEKHDDNLFIILFSLSMTNSLFSNYIEDQIIDYSLHKDLLRGVDINYRIFFSI